MITRYYDISITLTGSYYRVIIRTQEREGITPQANAPRVSPCQRQVGSLQTALSKEVQIETTKDDRQFSKDTRSPFA